MLVKINSTGQVAEVETKEKLTPGTEVLVDFEQIIEPAVVVCPKTQTEQKEQASFLRVMSEREFAAKKVLKEKAQSLVPEAAAKAERHGLNMKILDADFSFDEKKLTFYFSAENRVDFRSLVADLVGTFRKIIRLQQIGVREEAQAFGGFGKCGRELCCKRFIRDMEKVSAQLSEVQETCGAKSGKMLGCCGRTMCCLTYEPDSINQTKKKMPKIGSAFKNSQVEGKVVSQNVVEGKITVETAKGEKVEVII